MAGTVTGPASPGGHGRNPPGPRPPASRVLARTRRPAVVRGRTGRARRPACPPPRTSGRQADHQPAAIAGVATARHSLPAETPGHPTAATPDPPPRVARWSMVRPHGTTNLFQLFVPAGIFTRSEVGEDAPDPCSPRAPGNRMPSVPGSRNAGRGPRRGRPRSSRRADGRQRVLPVECRAVATAPDRRGRHVRSIGVGRRDTPQDGVAAGTAPTHDASPTSPRDRRRDIVARAVTVSPSMPHIRGEERR